MKHLSLILIFTGLIFSAIAGDKFTTDENLKWAENSGWNNEWSQTDFSKASLNFRAIISGGPPKDGIPSIDQPNFIPVAEETRIADTEPVISVFINGLGRAYPLRYLMFHEIVNDTFQGKPLAVTFCPLCNSSVVFERILNGEAVEFGTTGKLHHSDLVMYDRKTESWWQQYNGTAIVGELIGAKLKPVASRLESFKLFKQRFPDGDILTAPAGFGRSYGYNPYAKYDSSERPFLYMGDYQGAIPALSRVVVIGDVGYSLKYLAAIKLLEQNDLRITWAAGQNSALDSREIAKGKDVGNIIVQKMQDGAWQDVPYLVSFAFAYKAFYPEKSIITK